MSIPSLSLWSQLALTASAISLVDDVTRLTLMRPGALISAALFIDLVEVLLKIVWWAGGPPSPGA